MLASRSCDVPFTLWPYFKCIYSMAMIPTTAACGRIGCGDVERVRGRSVQRRCRSRGCEVSRRHNAASPGARSSTCVYPKSRSPRRERPLDHGNYSCGQLAARPQIVNGLGLTWLASERVDTSFLHSDCCGEPNSGC